MINRLSIVALILGLFTITFRNWMTFFMYYYQIEWFIFLLYPLILLTIIVSWISLRQLKRHPAEEGRGLAIAGLTLAFVQISIEALFVVLFSMTPPNFQ